MKKKKIVVLTGAGISAESGVKTFRDADGLWEGHDVEQVATPYGFQKNPELVLNFYNGLRKQLKSVQPNAAHLLLAELQKDYEVVIITQNVDDLHERAGSKNIIHLHGELLKMRSADNPNEIYDCTGDIKVGDLTPTGAQLRPHIVWFGEDVPLIVKAAEEVESADIVLMGKDIETIFTAIRLSRATIKNIKENLFWAFFYNTCGIPIAGGLLYLFTGHLLNPMIAGLAMGLSSVSVVSNALRLKRFK